MSTNQALPSTEIALREQGRLETRRVDSIRRRSRLAHAAPREPGDSPWFWLAVIVGLVLLIGRRRWDHSHPGSGEAMLAERFARRDHRAGVPRARRRPS